MHTLQFMKKFQTMTSSIKLLPCVYEAKMACWNATNPNGIVFHKHILIITIHLQIIGRETLLMAYRSIRIIHWLLLCCFFFASVSVKIFYLLNYFWVITYITTLFQSFSIYLNAEWCRWMIFKLTILPNQIFPIPWVIDCDSWSKIAVKFAHII